jgi:hypothetical protein
MSTTTITEAQQARLSVKPDRSAEEPISKELIEKLHEIPTFTDKYAERQWAKEHMAGAFRIFAKKGFNDGAGGHISLRDPVRPDCFWISTLRLFRDGHSCD